MALAAGIAEAVPRDVLQRVAERTAWDEAPAAGLDALLHRVADVLAVAADHLRALMVAARTRLPTGADLAAGANVSLAQEDGATKTVLGANDAASLRVNFDNASVAQIHSGTPHTGPRRILPEAQTDARSIPTLQRRMPATRRPAQRLKRARAAEQILACLFPRYAWRRC